ncbi:hypothetical protein [Flagellimonas marinaquae]
MNYIMKPVRLFIMLYVGLVMLVGCGNNDGSKNEDAELDVRLRSIISEIEVHIHMGQMDSAAIKIPKIVHPSSAPSPFQVNNDYTTAKGWSDGLNRSSNYYSYAEYYQIEKRRLMELFKDKMDSNKK